MKAKQIPEIGSWYWIKIKDFKGKLFGKILQDVTSKVYLVRLCTVMEDGSLKVIDDYFLCEIEFIGTGLPDEELEDYALAMEL